MNDKQKEREVKLGIDPARDRKHVERYDQAHPADTDYHIVRTTSNVDDTPIADFLPSDFVGVGNTSQDGLATLLDCQCEGKLWSAYVADESRLAEYVFGAGDIPDYLTVGCEDISHGAAHTIIGAQGDSGVTWSAPDRNGL